MIKKNALISQSCRENREGTRDCIALTPLVNKGQWAETSYP